VAVGLAACGGGGGSDSSGGDSSVTNLKLWIGGEADPVAKALVKRFNEKNPDIQVEIVSQPAANYYQEFHVANITHHGGDLAQIFPGYNNLQENIPYLVKLNKYIPASDQKRLYGLQYSSAGYDIQKGLYMVPYETQYYIGLYNEDLFKKAGIPALPKNWNELYADCGKLKKIGVTPISYGSDLYSAGAAGAFYAGFDVTNLMAGAISPSEVPGLYRGEVPWTSPAVVSQLEKWAKLYENGCTNSNPLSNSHVLEEYTKEQTAMFIAGDWYASSASLKPKLLSHTGVFAPPFVEGKQNLAVFSGAGYGAMSYGEHVPQAVKFLQFVASPEGQELVAKTGYANPAMTGLSKEGLNRQHKELLEWQESGEFTIFPWIDSTANPAVWPVIQSELPQVFVGKKSPEAALQAIQEATEELPAEQRELVFSSKGS
jgi:ABC-type glycerol-3-phosphate transport system substrate-binding protein